MSPDLAESFKVSAHVEELLNPDNTTVASNFFGSHKSSKKTSQFELKTPAINRSSIEPKPSSMTKPGVFGSSAEKPSLHSDLKKPLAMQRLVSEDKQQLYNSAQVFPDKRQTQHRFAEFIEQTAGDIDVFITRVSQMPAAS